LMVPSPSTTMNVTPGFKSKSECKNTCVPGSSYTHASTQWIPKHSVKRKESNKQLLHDWMSQLTTVRVANSRKVNTHRSPPQATDWRTNT
jgi:hypothetical protein